MPGAVVELRATETALTLIVRTPGDTNCDGVVEFEDIERFVHALLTQTASSSCSLDNADVNQDGVADGNDIAPFFELIIG